MGLTFKLELQENRVLAVVEGDFDINSVESLITGILDKCYEIKYEKVFVDVTRVTGIPTIMERFQFAETYAEMQRGYFSKFGYTLRLVVYGLEPLIDPERFGEIVGHNRGAVSIKVTTDLAEAENWLSD